MTSLPSSAKTPVEPQPPGGKVDGQGPGGTSLDSPLRLVLPPLDRAVASRDHRWAVALTGFVLLHVTHPLTWQAAEPAPCFGPVGIGLALVAWLGPVALLLVVTDGLLVALQTWLLGGSVGIELLVAPFVTAAQVWLSWWCFARLGKGQRRLTEPHSAIAFLLIVPGLVSGAFALGQASFWQALGLGEAGFGQTLSQFWMSRALAIVAWTVPLLVVLTPVLSAWRACLPEERFPEGDFLQPQSSGDVLEMVGLAFAACVFQVLLLRGALGSAERGGMAEGQVWGVPLLLVVWAAVRQGLRGGTLVAGAAAVVPLTLLTLGVVHAERYLFAFQGSLVIQCSTALLVAVSVNWIRLREAAYRRVVGHSPVVLYSARLLSTGTGASAEMTFVSPACVPVLQCPADLLVGPFERWLMRVHPRDREVLLAAIAQLYRQGADRASPPVTCEYRLLPAPSDRKERPSISSPSTLYPPPLPGAAVTWVRDTLVPHFAADGRLDGWEGVLTDITEQRLLADDLRRTTMMFHVLCTNLPAGVFFVQGNSGRPILVNARARQLLGRREDAAAGLEHLVEVYRLFRSDGTPYPLEELPVYLALRRGLTTMRDDIVVHRPDGRKVPLVVWAAPIDWGGTDDTTAAVWVLEDLSALRQAEAALAESEARLRTIIETMAEGVVVQNDKGTVIECNPAACALLGVAPDGLRGHTLPEATPSTSWTFLREDGSPYAAEEQPLQASLASGEPVRNLVLGLVAAGQPHRQARWVLVNSMPLLLKSGEPVQRVAARRGAPGVRRVVTTFADITPYRQVLENRGTSEETYRSLVESLPVGLIQFGRDLRIEYLNPAAVAIGGYVLGEKSAPEEWQALVHPADLPKAHADLARVFAGNTERTEARFRAKDGTERVVLSILHPRRADRGGAAADEIIGVTCVFVDLTRERQLEQELLRAQRAELIGRLSSGIAHDFNNLLTVILSLSSLARDKLSGEHPVCADLDRINEAGERAAELASQLLAFSKPRRAQTRPVEINQVAARTLELLRSTLPEKICVEAVLSPLPLEVRGDETQLQQVLMNLCLNARDAMPNGGRLQVQTAVVEDGDSDWVQLTVEDNGQGMAPEMRQRIFEPFFSTKEHGNGLGLAVVQQIVSSYGGRVDVSSCPGEGARFEVWLPRIATGE